MRRTRILSDRCAYRVARRLNEDMSMVTRPMTPFPKTRNAAVHGTYAWLREI